MSQLPPPPGGFEPPPAPGFAPTGAEKPSWSVAAITGFVLSVVTGCTIVGAALGMELGIVGIVRTRGGRRRGKGLAIAAIPISLVTGLIGVTVGLGAVSFARMAAQLERLKGAITTAATDSGEAAAQLRELCSDDFNDDVSDEQLQAWLEGVVATHGRLVDIPVTGESMASAQPGVISLTGKFVNGQVSIAITIGQRGPFVLAIDDIAVDGVSPRGSEGG